MQANELFIQPNTILLDGGMGTMLQAAGLKLGARPEELNITDPQLIESIHSRYAAAGSRIINANTFGASAHKLAGSEYTLEEIIAAGIANCKRACAPRPLASMRRAPAARSPAMWKATPTRLSGRPLQSRCGLCALSRGTACPPPRLTRSSGASVPLPPALPRVKAGRPR